MAAAAVNARALQIDEAISSVVAEIDGISELKCEQKDALKSFVNGEDVLALLPTGYSKSLIYQLLPRVCKKLAAMKDSSLFRGVENPIVIIVSPLVALMEDQVNEAPKFGVSAAQLGKNDEEIMRGNVELVFGGPENWILNDKWRDLLSSPRYRQNLVGIVVDEVHVTYKWGQSTKEGSPAFRESFSRLGELRSLVREDTPILALTASADTQSRERVISLLNMQGARRITVSPNKENIRLSIVKLPKNNMKCFDWVVKTVRDDGVAAPQMIIYCRSLKTTGDVHQYLLSELGQDAWVDGDPKRRMKNCFIGIYQGNTLPKYKQYAASSLNGDGNCRVVIATTSLSMGLNFPNISYVIMYGPPEDAEGILQQVGRAGRGGSFVNAVLYYHGVQLINVDKAVKGLLKTSPSDCLRKALYGLFEDSPISVEPGHKCCTHCHRTCTCAGEACETPFPSSESFINIVKLPTRYRNVDPEDRILIRENLQDYRTYLLANTTHLYTNAEACTGFSDELIDLVVDNCTHIFDLDYIVTHLPVFYGEHAKEILRIMYEVFGDIEYVEASVLESFEDPDIDYPGYFDGPDNFDNDVSSLYDSDSDQDSLADFVL
ncbi:ATP-dependent DNA helicase RecQ-like [Branchiostoma lanceolatum]|uniref:ATP-dependent DNA helicase RecQ-like n=1 Tax=Branchiostoma lanceolatum TaxID=7740 RepID=UPI003456E3CA